MIYFTSDAHIGHYNIIKYTARPKDWTLEMMWDVYSRGWNSLAGDNDQVYILGDFFWRSHPDDLKRVGLLKGQKFLIVGSHDHYTGQIKKQFQWMKDRYELSVPDTDARSGKQHIILSHCPYETWEGINYGTWHLHGHCHGRLKNRIDYARLDVSWDNVAGIKGTYDQPLISYDEVKGLIGGLKYEFNDGQG